MFRTREFFDQLLIETGNNEAALNMYLVVNGGRDATLIEFTNYGDEKGNRLVEIASSLPNVRSEWEMKGDHPPRYLIANKSVPDKLFTDALGDIGESMGKILGFKCPGDMGGRYTVNIYALISPGNQRIDIHVEMCSNPPKENQYEHTLEKMRSVDFPGLTFHLEISDDGYTYYTFLPFIGTSDIDTLFKYRKSIANTVSNIVTNSPIQSMLETADSKEKFIQVWNRIRSTVIVLAIVNENADYVNPELREDFFSEIEQGLLTYLTPL
jgi:hypothetical protein